MSSRLIPFQRLFIHRALPRSTASFSTSLRTRDTKRPTSDPTQHPNPQRAAQEDREKIDAQPNEYAKSGTDADTAANTDAAFDPNSSNDPDEVRKEAGKQNEVNPLDASPANTELSSGTEESGQAANSKDKKLSEGGGGRSGGGDSTGDKSGGSSV